MFNKKKKAMKKILGLLSLIAMFTVSMTPTYANDNSPDYNVVCDVGSYETMPDAIVTMEVIAPVGETVELFTLSHNEGGLFDESSGVRYERLPTVYNCSDETSYCRYVDDGIHKPSTNSPTDVIHC